MKQTLRTLLLAIFAIGLMQPLFAQIGIGVSVSFGPPALPVYDMPVCPGDGYLWTPGYWAYDDDDGYYWVPGTWVMAPEPGYLWTPGYWGWEEGGFLWHEGFWGTEVGFYGGINYGFGYFGDGFYGGRWQEGHFFYNTAVVNVNRTEIRNVYETRVDERVTENHVSYNGGDGGVTARPSQHDQQVAQARHLPPSSEQTQHVQAARSNPQMRAEANHGKPAVAATAKPGQFSGAGVVQAKQAGGEYKPAPARGAGGARPAGNNGARPAENNGARPAEGARPSEAPNTERPAEPRAGETPAPRADNPTHAKDVQQHTVQAPPSSGNPRNDLNYQKQQQKLADQQNKEHQKLQQQQEKEDQAAEKRNMDAQKKQQMEQKHAQQTQQMEQKHSQQQEQIHQKAPAPRPAPSERKPQ